MTSLHSWIYTEAHILVLLFACTTSTTRAYESLIFLFLFGVLRHLFRVVDFPIHDTTHPHCIPGHLAFPGKPEDEGESSPTVSEATLSPEADADGGTVTPQKLPDAHVEPRSLYVPRLGINLVAPCFELSFMLNPTLPAAGIGASNLPNGPMFPAVSHDASAARFSVQRIRAFGPTLLLGEETWGNLPLRKTLCSRFKRWWNRSTIAPAPRIVVVPKPDEARLATYAMINSQRDDRYRANKSSLAVIHDVVRYSSGLFVVMDRYDTTLENFLESGQILTKDFVFDLGRRIFSAINELHANNFSHGSVTTRSILLADTSAFLADFATSKPLTALTRASLIQADFHAFALIIEDLIDRLAASEEYRTFKDLISFGDLRDRTFVPRDRENCRVFANLFEDDTTQLDNWNESLRVWALGAGSQVTKADRSEAERRKRV